MLNRLGKYEIRAELGKGAMGMVYLAQDTHLGRPAALKMMSPGVAGDAELLKRFYQEAVSAGKLSHPSIVTIYDIDQSEGVPYIAMEFLEGQTLQQMIHDGCKISIVRKLDIIKQAAAALHFAHQNGVIHRDVKPSNIMVLKNGQVKIVDFGVARVDGAALTLSGSVLGTPYYMSPEQVRGEKVDGRSDIFSLGVILYEMFALKNPFAGRDVASSLNRISRHTPQPLAQLVPECPAELQKIVERATAKSREQRYQSAEDMFVDTAELCGTLRRTIVDQHVRQGERLLREGNLALAEDTLRKALEVDSSHNLARSLLREVQEQIKARRRQEQVRELLRRAERAALSKHDQECFDLAGEALSLEPADERAQLYRKEAGERLEQARLAAERLAALRAHVLDAVQNQDFEDALRAADSALLEFPGDAGLQDLRQQAEAQLEARRQELRAEECARTVEDLIAAGQWSDGLACVEEALGDAPGNDRLRALRKSVLDGQARARMEAARREAIAQCRALIEQRNFAAARDQLERTVASVGQSAELTALMVFVAEQQRQERRIDETLTEAQLWLQQEKYAEAIRLLEEAGNECPSPQIDALLNRARQELTQRKSDTLRAARDLLGQGEASRAVEALKAAPAACEGDEEFERLLAQASGEVERATLAFRNLELAPSSDLSSQPLDQEMDVPVRNPTAAPETAASGGVFDLRRRPLLLVAAAVMILMAIALAWRLFFHRQEGPRMAAQPPMTATESAPVGVSPAVMPPVAVTSGPSEASPRKRVPKKPLTLRAASGAKPGGRAVIASKFGQLTIASDVVGARIVLDGEGDAGWTTPHMFDKLKPGVHHVGLLMSGRPATYADTTVEAGTARVFNLPMQRPTGTVHITTQPPGLQVLIDGQPCGPSPVQKNLTVGHHTWTIVLPTGGYSSSFDLTEGALLDAHYPARGRVSASGTGSVTVRSNPPGATVFVDGTPVAKTNVTLKLAPGSHSLVLSLPGCPPYSQPVAITAGASAPPVDKQFRCN